MAEARRIEIGFEGGQVMTVRLDSKHLDGLRKAVERDSGWHDLDTDEGAVSLDLTKVVFIRAAASPHTIGFSGQ
jgi:hypothetical protein